MLPRTALALIAAVALAACGGSPAPDATVPAPTAAPSAEPEATAAPSSAPTAAATAAPTAAAAEPPAPQHTPPTLDGQLLGKPFKAVGACAVRGAEPGKVALEIYAVKDFDPAKCMVLPPVEGNRKLGFVLAWKEGEKIDVTKLAVKKEYAEGYVMEVDAAKKFSRKDFNKDLKPKGTIEILKAPKEKGAVGRIKISITNGKDKLEGEIDVDVKGDFVGE
jgi:hypothetical protein